MKGINKSILKAKAIAVCLTFILACNSQVNEQQSGTETSAVAPEDEKAESIPDSVIQFLIVSAAMDFNEHFPPTAVDFRNVEAGYLSSETEKIYLICGEFLTQEKNEWVVFTTIKTSGYEQYIGENEYCRKATFIKSDSNRISEGIKEKLAELKK
jgi:hypothetical protein